MQQEVSITAADVEKVGRVFWFIPPEEREQFLRDCAATKAKYNQRAESAESLRCEAGHPCANDVTHYSPGEDKFLCAQSRSEFLDAVPLEKVLASA